MITAYEIPIGPARERLMQTIEYRREYHGGAPAAVTYTWRGEYDVESGDWVFHPIQKYRVQDGCGGGNSKPQKAPDGHVEAMQSELIGEARDIHRNCPLYCGHCGGRMADSVYAQD